MTLMNYKLIIGVVLLILSICIGIEFAKKYKKKRVFFTEFYSFNDILLSEISFGMSTIPQIIKTNYLEISDFYSRLQSKYIDKNNDFLKIAYLNDKENEFFKFYIDNIGKSGSISSLEYVKSVKSKIESYQKDAVKLEEKNKPLCIKLSIIIGLIALIALL